MGNKEDSIFLDQPSDNLSRRGFVKGLTLAGCALAFTEVVGLTGCASDDSAEDTAAGQEGTLTPGYQYYAESAEGEWIYGACPRNCFDSCAMMTKVVDGTIVAVRGNPDNPYTAGGLCVKTQNYVDWVYHPDRITYPMKRTGKKGPGNTFERITWDEAIDTITTKWKEIIATDGPEAIACNYFSGTFSFVQGDFFPANVALFRKMKATNLMPGKCSNSKGQGFGYSIGAHEVNDTERIAETDLYIDWGFNACNASPHFVKYIKQLKKNGGQLIVVNPVRIPICDWADMYIQIAPKTDSAFCLGVANEIISNGWADLEFIEQYGTGFEEYRAAAEEWTLEKTAETCQVTVDEIKKFAELYGTTKNSILRSGVQPCRNQNGGMLMFNIALLPALIGHIGRNDVDGFITDTSAYWVLNQGLTSCPHFMNGTPPSDNDPGTLDVRSYPNAHTGRLLNGMDGDKFNYSAPLLKSFYIFNANTLASDPETNLIIEGLLREDLFTIVHENHMTPTTEYADIILPATTHFEGEDIGQAYGSTFIVYNEPCIEPPGEAKNNWEVAQLLAKAMGYTDPEFDLTVHDHVLTLIEGAAQHPYCSGLSYEQLKRDHFFKVEPLGIPNKVLLDGGFNTDTGLINFSNSALQGPTGFSTAAYTADPESKDGDQELYGRYPLSLISNCPKEYLNGTFGNMAVNNLLFGDPLVYIQTDDAQRRGINDGDRVRLFNDRGEAYRTASVGDYVPQGAVQAFKGTWDTFAPEANINILTRAAVTDLGFNTAYLSALVEIEKV